MASEIEIVNGALVLLGRETVMQISPAEDNERSRIMALRYPQARDRVLAAHKWNAALFRAQVAVDAAAPAFEFANSYSLPTDPFCLRAVSLYGTEERFVVEGRKLLTDAGAPLNLKYIGRELDTENYPPLLVDAIEHRLAAMCALRLTGETNGKKLQDDIWQSYKNILTEARWSDAVEGTADAIEVDRLLDARAGRNESRTRQLIG